MTTRMTCTEPVSIHTHAALWQHIAGIASRAIFLPFPLNGIAAVLGENALKEDSSCHTQKNPSKPELKLPNGIKM